MPETDNKAAQITEMLTKRGFLVELSISSWSGRTKLLEADLGLEGLTDADLHRLGRRQLVPSEELAKISKVGARARARLMLVSYAFPIGGARFVPEKLLASLLADLSEIRSDFTEAAEEFCNSFETLAAQTRAAWRENAQKLKTELGKGDDWLQAFEARLNASYPPIDQVRAAFHMEWNLFQFALPKGLRKQLISTAEAMEAGRLAEEARAQLEAKVAGFVGEAAVELRRRAGELCAHVAEQVKKSGEKVSEKTLQPLRDLIEQFKALDFTGDDGFAADLEKLKSEWLGADKEAGKAAELRKDADYRSEMSSALESLATKAVAESEAAAAEALERFLKYGGAGRAVAV